MRRLVLLSALAATLVPSAASANGSYTHVHISQLAAEELPPGELRDIVNDPAFLLMYEAGSMFPDSGYAISHAYGEESHWPPYVLALEEQLRTVYGGDFSSTAAREALAFFLGVASHSIADQIYDHTIWRRAKEIDGDPGEVDSEADYFIVIDQDVRLTTEAWAPYPDAVAALDEISVSATVDELMMGMSRMEFVIFIQQRAAYNNYVTAWQNYPWLGTHIYNEEVPGSLPHMAGHVAAYWQVLYDRIRGTDDIDTDLVVGTIPEDGQVNWPVDPAESEALLQIGISFGYGVRRAQVDPLIRLVDESGATVATTIHTPYETSGDVNFVMLRPTATLLYDHQYTVEISAGIRNVAGEETSAPYTFSFRTRCADNALASCPPLDPPWVTGPIPTEPPPITQPAPDMGTDPDTPDMGPAGNPTVSGGGGCAVLPSSAMASPALALLLALGGIAARRRRR